MKPYLLRLLLFPSLLACGFPVYAQTTGMGGFQELPWGASERQISLKYRGLVKQAECTAFSRQIAERLKGVCDYPIIEPYQVTGIPFKLAFYLSAKTRSLSSVGLFYEAEVDTPQPNQSLDASWRQRYQNLRSALSDRYGFRDDENVTSHGRFVGAKATWRRGDTIIELVATFVRGAASPSREQYEVTYRPASDGEGGKL